MAKPFTALRTLKLYLWKDPRTLDYRELGRSFPSLLVGVELHELGRESVPPMHGAVRERLERIEVMGPEFFLKLRFSSSDLSDLRLRPSRDQRWHLIAELRRIWRQEPTYVRSCLESADDGLDAVAGVLEIARHPRISPEKQTVALISLAREFPGPLHQVFACYVDLFSAWELCSQWATALSAEINNIPRDDDGAHLLGALGAVLAAERRSGFDPFLLKSIEIASEPWDKYFFALRWATASLKRSGSRLSFERACDVAGHLGAELAQVNEDDGTAAALVLGNLQSLALVMNGDMHGAARMSEGLVLRLEEVRPALPDNVWRRYCTTLRVNNAVATAAVEGPTEAIVRLRRALAACAPEDVGSITEVRALLALFLVRAGRPGEAVPLIEMSARSAYTVSGVTQLREICRVAAIAHSDLNRDESAAGWLAASQADDPRETMPV